MGKIHARIASTISNSVGMPLGRAATQMADRACPAASPNAVRSNSDAPFTTAACSPNFGVQLTNPVTFRT